MCLVAEEQCRRRGASGIAFLLNPLEDRVAFLPNACHLCLFAAVIEESLVGFKSGRESATEDMDMLTDHFLVEVGGFLGGLEGLVLLSIIGEIDREVVEGSGEAVGERLGCVWSGSGRGWWLLVWS